jgi:hypothetical protein
MNTLIERLANFPEINPANYTDDDVNALNAWGIAAHTAIEALQDRIESNNALCIKRVAEVTREREALQAEVERLQREVVNRNQRALDGDKALLVRDAEFARNEELQAEVERLKVVQLARFEALAAYTVRLEAERDTLRAELDALKGAEPVMIYHGGCTIDCGEHGHHNMEMLKLIPAGTKLYANAAPQAPAPTKTKFTCWQIPDTDSWYEHPADAQIIHDLFGEDPKVGDEYELSASIFARTVRYRITSVSEDGDCEVEAAHGITEAQG